MRERLVKSRRAYVRWALFLFGLLGVLCIHATKTATGDTASPNDSSNTGSCEWEDSNSCEGKWKTAGASKEDAQDNKDDAWHRPFLSFFEEHQDNMPVLSFLKSHFSDDASAQDKEPKDSTLGENPFLSFLDAIQQTKDSILGVDKESDSTDDSSSGSWTPKERIVASVLEKARHLAQQDEEANALSIAEFVSCMKDALQKVAKQLQDNFGSLLTTNLDAYIALAIPYFAMVHDATNSPLQKRRLHRFYETLTKDDWIDLHDALYLSQLAYVDTIEQFETGLANFDNNSWTKLYGTTQSLPDLPASFLLLHKELDPEEILEQLRPPKTLLEQIQNFVAPDETSEVLVILLVRGTKHVADFLQDGLLEPEEYKGGYAHGGILASGKNLAAQYLPKLQDLQQVTRKYRIANTAICNGLMDANLLQFSYFCRT